MIIFHDDTTVTQDGNINCGCSQIDSDKCLKNGCANEQLAVVLHLFTQVRSFMQV